MKNITADEINDFIKNILTDSMPINYAQLSEAQFFDQVKRLTISTLGGLGITVVSPNVIVCDIPALESYMSLFISAFQLGRYFESRAADVGELKKMWPGAN